MAESPRQVIEVFSATRSRLHDSLDYYNLLSHESRCYYYLNQMDEAFRVNGQVITYCERNALADRNRIRILLGDAYNNRGVFWQELGQRDSALLSLKKAADALRGVTTPRTSLPSIYVNLADCYMQEGDYSWCGYYYRQALLQADSLGIGDRDYFAIYSGLAKLYTELGNYPEADDYFRKAEQLRKSCTAYERYFFANTRGNYYYNTKEYDHALEWFRRADRITDAFPQPLYKAIVHGNLGETFILLKQPDSARFYLDDARRLFGKAYDQPAFRYYMDGLYASLALLENDLPLAERLLSGVYEQEQVNPLYTYYNNRRMAELYEKKGDYRKAFDFSRMAEHIDDSLRNEKVRNSLAEIDFRYRQDTTLLRKDMQLISAREEVGQWKMLSYIFVLLLLSFFLTVLSLYLYRRRRREKQYWARMMTVNRLKMALVRSRVSPHFIFNVLNAVLPSLRQYGELDQPIRLLVKVLRSNLSFSERLAVPMSEEIGFVKDYLRLRLWSDPDRIRIVWDLPEPLPSSWLVPSMFIQIPVENAVKHAFDPDDREACVRIRAWEKEEYLHIQILDNGDGFWPDRESKTVLSHAAEQGTGSGLRIIRQTVDLLNLRNVKKMSFLVQNREQLTPDTHGTMVSIVIPLEYMFELCEEITVVIVDDDPVSIRNLSNDLMTYPDIQILETTTSVEKAQKIIIRQQPDLLFLDVEMPKQSGLELWKSIQSDVHANMRVVFYTAYDSYLLKALRASAFDFLMKPYLPDELDEIINRFRSVFYRSKANMEQSMRRLLADDRKFAIQTVTGLLFLKRRDVLMFHFSESNRCWQLLLADRTEYKLRMSLAARDLLNMSVSFVQISQNCIVNLEHLCTIENKTLECRLYPPYDDIELVASRRYYGKVKELLEII